MKLSLTIWEGLKIALDALKQHRLRAILATLGIVIGITMVVGIASIIDGLNKAFYSSISALGSDTLYIQKIPWFAEDYWTYRNRKDLTLKEAQAVREYATLASAVSPMVGTSRDVKFGNQKLNDIIVVGTNHEFRETGNAIPELGRFLSEADVHRNRHVCVLGYEASQKLFERINPLGRTIKVGGHPFQVVGVLEEKGKFLGIDMDTRIYVPVGAFNKLFGIRKRYMTIGVKVVDQEHLEDAKDELRGILRRVRKVPPDKEDDFAINQQDVFSRLYNSLTGGLWAAAIGIAAMSLLVGGIGIMNILLVSVTERTREIGIRKAIGARRRDILWQFLIESLAITAVGGAIGFFIGLGLGRLVSAVKFLPSSLAVWMVYIGIGFVTAVGLLFGIYPASKAARLNPIDALSYE
ncbi:MAG: ABC transporter permease [Gemmatimonadota bacterium]|nr:MAG: ABC transporter permease [Gemmatimonadota bacterium]